MPEDVGDPCDERRLGPDDDEVDGERPGEREQALGVIRRHRVTRRERGDARVPGRGVQLGQQGRGAELPGERVFPPTRPDDEDTHGGLRRERQHGVSRRAGSDESDGDGERVRDERDVGRRRTRERRRRRALPTSPGSVSKTGAQWWKSDWCAGKVVGLAAVRQPVADADRDLGEAREDVELRQRKRR